MDFALSAEQLLIKDSVERYATGTHGPDDWSQFAELGWLGIGAPEELGGFGGAVETLLLMEAFGRGLVSAPYVAAAVLPGAILRAAGRDDLLEALVEGKQRFAVAYEEPHARYRPSAVTTGAARDGNDFLLRGRKTRVLAAAAADRVIVSARTGDEITLFAVPVTAPGLRREPYGAEDGHAVGEVILDDVRVAGDAVVGPIGGGLALLEPALDRATAALCAEGVGLMSVMLEMTVAYSKERHQFGVAIGSFQALQHRMAEMYIELELARSMSYVAAMTLEDPSHDAARARGISAAKVQIARSGRFIGQNAIQLHGGIGMSEEYKVGHYFKRMTMVERLLGDTDYHLARYVANRQVAERETVSA